MVDEVLVGRLQGGVLVAGDIDPGQGVAGHSGSRVRRQWWAVRECFTGTDSSHEFLLGVAMPHQCVRTVSAPLRSRVAAAWVSAARYSCWNVSASAGDVTARAACTAGV